MRIYFPTVQAAQAFANRIHNWMMNNNDEYAHSVSIGQTLRWAIPARGVLAQGDTSTDFFCAVKPRCMPGLEEGEIPRVVPNSTKPDTR